MSLGDFSCLCSCGAPPVVVDGTEAIDCNRLVSEPTRRKFNIASPAGLTASRDLHLEGVKPSIEDGECLVIIEGAEFSGAGGQSVAIAARAWAELPNGTRVGSVAEWPARQAGANSTSWCAARPLGFRLSEQQGATLHMELLQAGRSMGSLGLSLSELASHSGAVTRELVAGPGAPGAAPKLSLQVLDSSCLSGRRRAYLVRHGESTWNVAQAKLDVYEMARKTDHPLSAKGCEQAESLALRLARASQQGDEVWEPMLNASVVYASPLVRAIETAVIALGQTMRSQGPHEMVLLPHAREKLNLGGLDTWSSKVGVQVVKGAHDELRDMYSGRTTSTVLDDFGAMRFNVSEVEDKWWCEGVAESATELQERLRDFMFQLLYSPQESAVVVGHSHFFRSVFREFLSRDFKERHPALTRDLCSKKLPNCGVVAIDIELGAEGGPIVAVQLMPGTRLEEDHKALACCATPAIADMDAEIIAGDDASCQARPAAPAILGADNKKVDALTASQ